MAASPEDSKAQAGQALLLGVPLAANYALKQKFPSMSSWQRLGIAATLGVLAKNAYSRLG